MRKLMWFTIGFAIACALSAYCFLDSWMVPLIALSALLTVACGWKQWKKDAFVFLGLALGLAWFLLYRNYYLLPAMANDGVTVETELVATDYSYETTYGQAVDGQIKLSGKTYQIRAYINEAEPIEPGDVIRGSFRLRYTAPGGREEVTYHSGKGILLLGYERGGVELIRAAAGEVDLYASELAYEIKAILRRVFPEDVFPFTQALLLGDNSELSYETDTAFKISGIRHIIAVSGLHVTILYSIISAITFRKRFLTALLGLPTLFVFAAVAGFTPSVTRACIMVALMILAQLCNREYDSPTALAFASLAMLAVNPLVITGVGFQLTVGCVAGILLFDEPISNYLKEKLGNPKGKSLKARLKRWFSSSVSVTLSAMSLTTPLSAYYFGAVSIVGVVTNLLTLWAITWIFIGIVAVCLIGLLSVRAAALLAWIVAWAVRYVLWLSAAVAKFPLAAVYTASPYIVAWLIFAYLLLAVFLFSHKKRPATLFFCGVLGLFLAVGASYAEPLTDDVRVTALDVGQGQSILLQSDGRTYLVDCGGDSDTMTADTVAETLLSQGITRLDGIILTHGDRDHAGAVANLLSRIQTDMLLIPATTDSKTVKDIVSGADGEVIWVEEDIQITFGDTEITVFGPLFLEDSNENSLCVLFDTENCDILVTGDRGELGEMMLLREHTLPEVDVLIAGHHGSKYSTTEALLNAVKPEIVIISAGEDNPYGHPAQETLDRLNNFGCRVYRTDIHGTVIIRR